VRDQGVGVSPSEISSYVLQRVGSVTAQIRVAETAIVQTSVISTHNFSLDFECARILVANFACRGSESFAYRSSLSTVRLVENEFPLPSPK
jgi:hypothetical protein